jgi:uncharacterized membrane protein
MSVNSDALFISIRLLVFITLAVFIILMERNMVRAHVRGRIERLLEMVAAFVMGIVVRGLILLLP